MWRSSCCKPPKATPRLATLDQLDRVIYARSFSKTLSGSLRVGFVACSQNVANELADIKMLTSITTSPFTERLIYLMLVDGHYRKFLSRLHERLGEARINVVRAFERIGLELFAEPADGMFVWARFPHIGDSLALAAAAGGGQGGVTRPAEVAVIPREVLTRHSGMTTRLSPLLGQVGSFGDEG